MAGLPEIRSVARPQRWHPILEAAASQAPLRAAAKEALALTELRADVMRCLSVALDSIPTMDDRTATEGMCAVLAAASLVEIYVSSALRSTQEQLLQAAQAAPPMEASKYFSAMLSQEEDSAEFIGSKLSAFRSIEELQLTGLVKPDSPPSARSQKQWNKQNKGKPKHSGDSSAQAEVSVGPCADLRGRSKGQSSQPTGGAGQRS